MTDDAQKSGFSLVEMLAVIILLGVVVVLVIPRIYVNKTTSKNTACVVNKRYIELQAQLWKRKYGSWPSNNLSNMLPTSAPPQYDYFPDGLPVCPVDGSAYVLDSTTHEVVGHNH